MRPVFTIHAGEYLFGSFIESKFKNLHVWVPTKDTGVDLLVSDASDRRTITFQVKFSKDFLVTHMSQSFRSGLEGCGWWTLRRDKIEESRADYWVFVLYGFGASDRRFIVIRPHELLERLVHIHGDKGLYQVYLWVTRSKKCWETRGLRRPQQILVANDAYKNVARDFTPFLDRWTELEKLNNKAPATG